jgi:hypothetical protein
MCPDPVRSNQYLAGLANEGQQSDVYIHGCSKHATPGHQRKKRDRLLCVGASQQMTHPY